MEYEKSTKYSDLETIYAQCGGPGGLKLAEFIASKLGLQPGSLLLDIGVARGYQTCFLAKEYGVFVVGIDPWSNPSDPKLANVEHLVQNARRWGVQDRTLGVQVGLPDTRFADNSFDVAYSTTTLEMIRGLGSRGKYRECLAEVLRVLRPGGLFGYGDPMHHDVEMPPELVPLVTQGKGAWADCFATLDETIDVFRGVGFEVVEADHARHARLWWDEYCEYDPGCRANPDEDPKVVRVDAGRWLSYGYVIAKKPG